MRLVGDFSKADDWQPDVNPRPLLCPQEQFREMEMYSPEGNGVRGPGAPGGPGGPGRGGLRGRGGPGIMRGGPPTRGFPPMRGGRGGALLSPPGMVRPPQAPAGLRPPLPQALLPRPMGAKTKVLSILDRARVAMEESYSGAYDDDQFYDGGG